MNEIKSKDLTLHSISIAGDPCELTACCEKAQAFQQAGPFGFLFVLLFMVYAPTSLIWLGIIPFKYRFLTFFCILTGFICYCFLRHFSLYELGFRKDNFTSSIRWNLLFSALGTIGLFATYKAGFIRSKHVHYLPYAYLAYIFLLGPVQEIIFRGILFAEMKRIPIIDSRWMLFISTLSFSFLHIIYKYPPLLIITFISGLVWGAMFTKCPNIWGISLSHSLLGALAMFLGML